MSSRTSWKGLGAVALGPDHVAHQLESAPAQDDGRALQLGPLVQGLGPDALVYLSLVYSNNKYILYMMICIRMLVRQQVIPWFIKR